ncbi:DUF5103 domain-containing protein [Flammeovirga sp. EKP202]|uniref:type IX secretion system plug protein n=1 Tax=Flammeovirga sp. EKP202 TaxID=2770592 RepID=UPI00165F04E5|nr:DUF5103 domain-containing protein [Flammeovirga sp. EKP202]MBD0403256.1 DUF5103 domain-containing protein [Flammeovirga sp. EKP202]
MHKILPLFSIILFLFTSVVKAQPEKWEIVTSDNYENKEIRYSDYVYDPNVRTVQLYAKGGSRSIPQLNSPVVRLDQQFPLILEFDLFGDDADYFEAEIEHCNKDWTPSELQPIEFMQSYNSFKLNDFDFSMNTSVPYVHFIFQLPKVKMSGNYLLKVYREGDKDDLIITKRFVVYEKTASIASKMVEMRGSERRYMQQIDFTVNYGGLTVVNPKRDFSVTILQNGRWDNPIVNLLPRFVRGHEQVMDYSYYDGENAFLGLNEFRVFEISSVNTSGASVSSTDIMKNFRKVRLRSDLVRNKKAFNQQQNDYNGGYVIAVFGKTDYWVESDYMEVFFTLKSETPFAGDVYAYGGFSQWQLNEENKMIYDERQKAYVGSTIVKQGRYDYMYTVVNTSKMTRDDVEIEGSFNLTRNQYEILVYYRGPGDRADRVVGYRSLSANR